MALDWKKDRKYRGTKGALRRDQAAGQKRAKDDMAQAAEIRGRLRAGRLRAEGDR